MPDNSESIYEKIGKSIGTLVTEKQLAYGDSFSNSCKIIEVLYPNGISTEQYKDFLTIIRIVDKLFRIANDKEYGGESPFGDIAGYSILSLYRNEKETYEKSKNKISS